MPTADTTSSDKPKPLQPSPEGTVARQGPAVSKRPRKRRWLVSSAVAAVVLALGAAGGWYWWQLQLNALPPGIAQANGRLEAEQVEISTKYPLRIAAVLVKEGDLVQAGQVLARMDTVELEAQLHNAEAKVRVAEHQKTEAESVIVERESERTFATQQLRRDTLLNQQNIVSQHKLEQDQNEMRTAVAAYETAVASLDAAKAAIAANQAEADHLRAEINDSTLVAPVRGRIQYKLAQPGEVLQSGGRVLTLLDLSDIYLTIFLPAHDAAPLAIGDDARIILDPFPDYVFPATVTFVATEAQFTPKTVETEEEREKLMFRVKLSAPPEIVSRYVKQVHTGVRGIGFVKTSRDAVWPAKLAVKLP
jgi:HlyD family secretion protein